MRDIEMFLDSESSSGAPNNLADFDDQDYLVAMDSDSEDSNKQSKKKKKKKIYSSDEEDYRKFCSEKD